MADCQATVEIDSIGGDGSLTFSISVDGCPRTEGWFEYDVIKKRENGDTSSFTKRASWSATDSPSFDVDDRVDLDGDESIDEVNVGTIECSCMSDDKKVRDRGEPYIFNLALPPLLRDHPDPYEVLPSSLVMELGSDSEHLVTEEVGAQGFISGDSHWKKKYTTDQVISRSRLWYIAEPPVHYALDTMDKKITFTGVKKTVRSEFENASSLELGAGTKFLNAKYRQSLKFTEEQTTEWREEFTRNIEVKFLANHTYATWILVDRLRVVRSTHIDYIQGDGQTYKNEDPHYDVIADCVLKTYHDEWPDELIPKQRP